MPIPPPSQLFERRAHALRRHGAARAGVLLGFAGFYVANHTSTTIRWLCVAVVAIALAVWWHQGRTGLTSIGVAGQLLKAAAGLGAGWGLAWLVGVLGFD
ncbi:MAG: hypothetical protein EOO29_11225 [Comamonadaceae bacterium]|nr:MAG: hypothetical protein EOO29_11225 [Comamonadaceae bacterium]